MLPRYSISVCGGFERIACNEIQTLLKDTGELQIIDRKPKRILLSFSGQPRELLSLRSAEHVFLIIKKLSNVTRSRHSLSTLKKSLGRIDFHPHFEICRQVGIRLKKRVTFRVTSQLSGQRNFRRIDLQRAVEHGLMTYGWRLTHERPALDVWIEVHGEDAYVSIRLSPMEMARRDYKQAHMPASLKPPVAYSLVQLSDPQPDDVFLDAMCGVGTILIERAYSGRYRYLLGGDISGEAIDAAQINIGKKHRPRQLFCWDAGRLPLSNWSVDKIVCNLPFGGKIGDEIGNQKLYRQFLIECKRVLKPTGRMVLLTTQQSMLENLLKQRRSFRVARKFKIDLLGQSPSAYVCLPR